MRASVANGHFTLDTLSFELTEIRPFKEQGGKEIPGLDLNSPKRRLGRNQQFREAAAFVERKGQKVNGKGHSAVFSKGIRIGLGPIASEDPLHIFDRTTEKALWLNWSQKVVVEEGVKRC